MKGLGVGRIVHYVLRPEDVAAIQRRRVGGAGHGENWPMGAQAHVGNEVKEGEHVPMVITAVWSETNGCSNGQALLDGNDSLWVTSAVYDPEGSPGSWHWPEMV